MNTVLEQDTLEVPVETDIKKTEEATDSINSIDLSMESAMLNKGVQKYIHHLSNEENQVILNGSCSHSGPHGSRYHGQSGGGWCYWCYICNPSNPKSY